MTSDGRCEANGKALEGAERALDRKELGGPRWELERPWVEWSRILDQMELGGPMIRGSWEGL